MSFSSYLTESARLLRSGSRLENTSSFLPLSTLRPLLPEQGGRFLHAAPACFSGFKYFTAIGHLLGHFQLL
ncbi:MAG: hypothetical protein A2Y86_02940 [Candidatus Aminicenantes bacterium RBG_13_62_12]|nr:MAG: hypothetical protein A2Y86_02940 [Candidatus Aminicenantes bacterium RBG_13_62_12]